MEFRIELVRPPAQAYTSPNHGKDQGQLKRLKEDIPMRACLCRFSGVGSIVGLVTMLMWSGTAVAQQDSDHAVSALLAGTLFIFILGMGLVCYVYMALALQTIAKKTGTPDGWLSWIPIANIILMLNIAKKPLWWILLFLVPLANIVIAIIV